jgi:hypothetical protein
LSEARRCFISIAFQICFRYAIRKIQESKEGLELNGTHQLMVYADVILLGENIKTIKKRTDAGKEIGLEVNAEKSKHIFMSRHRTAGQSHYIKVANKSFENVA